MYSTFMLSISSSHVHIYLYVVHVCAAQVLQYVLHMCYIIHTCATYSVAQYVLHMCYIIHMCATYFAALVQHIYVLHMYYVAHMQYICSTYAAHMWHCCMCATSYICVPHIPYGVATISRLLKIIRLFCRM